MEDEEELSFLTLPKRQSKNKGSSIIIYATIFNLIILTFSLLLVHSSHQHAGMNSLLKATSFYSPILDRLEIKASVKQMNATLFPSSHPSIARQKPNPEADVIWREFELTRAIIISGEDVRRLGKDPETAAKFEDAYWHFGDDAYIGQLDVFHQLHCLNVLRKLLYPAYYNNTPQRHPELYYAHYDHCVDVLYQNIICTTNTDLNTMNWMETQHHPFPDFSINHQCRDFGALVAWRKENSVDMEKWHAMQKPEGVKEVPVMKEYWEIFGGAMGE
ncbi:hypothetical protein B0O99DRAFT_560560, partial [Bisporella sp. PMI_857]